MARLDNRRLAHALRLEGLVPPNCRNIEVQIGIDGATVIRYEVFVNVEDIPRVIRALEAVTAKSSSSAREP